MATVNKQAIAAAFGRAAAHYEQHADLQRQSADALLAMLPQWIFYLLAFAVYERGRERKVIFVCALLVVLGCLAEGYISPFFLKKVL